MLSEFEKALARGEDLQQTRERLIQQTEDQRRRMLAQIEQDFREAQIIEYGLTLPRHTPAFGTAKGAVTWFRKKWPADDSAARELMKVVWESQHRQRKGAVKNDEDGSTKRAGDPAEEQRTVDGGSDPSEEALHEPIPEIEP